MCCARLCSCSLLIVSCMCCASLSICCLLISSWMCCASACKCACLIASSLSACSLLISFSMAVHLSSFCPVPSTVPFFGHAVVAPQPVQIQPFWPHSFCAECSALQFSADALDALRTDGRSLEVAQR